MTEAKQLEKLGANFISISLTKNLRFDDDRTVDLDTAILIKNSLITAKCVGEIDFDLNNFNLIKEVDFDYVQFSSHKMPPSDFIRDLNSQAIEIICSGITAAHDDDPSWILSQFLEEKELSNAYFQIDLLPEYQNAWEFLKYESPEYPDELQIEDINQLAEENKLLITLNYSSSNIMDVISYFPNIKGISLVLGNSLIEDLHCWDYSEVLETLKEINFNV